MPVCTWFFTPLLESSPHTGASLTDVTVIDMVAVFEFDRAVVGAEREAVGAVVVGRRGVGPVAVRGDGRGAATSRRRPGCR